MTIIVALASEGKVYMAGDRAYSDGNTIVKSNETKIFGTGQFLVGCAGNIGIAQALRYHYEWPPVVEHDHIHSILIPDMQTYLTERFILDNEDPCHILIGYDGVVYEVTTAGWACVTYPLMAIGSGRDFAVGSLFSTEGDPWDRIELAMAAAIEHSPGCSYPVDTLVIEP